MRRRRKGCSEIVIGHALSSTHHLTPVLAMLDAGWPGARAAAAFPAYHARPMIRPTNFALLFILAILPLCGGCHAPLQRYEYNETKLGAGFRIVLYARDTAHADRAAQAGYKRAD